MSNNQSLFSEITPSQEANLSGGFSKIKKYIHKKISTSTTKNTGTNGLNNGISAGTNNGNIISIQL